MLKRLALALATFAFALPAGSVEIESAPEPLSPNETPASAASIPLLPAGIVPAAAAGPISTTLGQNILSEAAKDDSRPLTAAQPELARMGTALQLASGQTPAARADAEEFELDAGFDHSAFRSQGDATCGHCGFVAHNAPSDPFEIPERLEPRLPSRQNEEDWTKETSLHGHSNLSDGTMSPEDVVQRAFDQGVKKIALSDHDTVAGIQRAWRKARELGIEFHPSAELTARGGVHVGAVDIDIFNPKLTALLARVRAARYKRAAAIAAFLNGPEVERNLEDLANRWTQVPRQIAPEDEEGKPRGDLRRGDGENLAQKALDALREFRARGGEITLEQIVTQSKYEEGGTIELPHMARALVANGLIAHVDDAFNTFFKTLPSLPDVPPDPTYQEVLDAVHAAGGKAFLNHPYTVHGRDDDDKDRKARAMLARGFDGIEAYRPSNATSRAGRRRADERVAKYLTWAEELGLIVGNGADYHGEDTHLNHIVVWMPKDLEAELLRSLSESNARALAALENAERRPPPSARALPAVLPLLAVGADGFTNAPVLWIAAVAAFVLAALLIFDRR